MKYYKNQTHFSTPLTLTANVNLKNAASVYMEYKKPSGAEGRWTASIVDESIGQIVYRPQTGELDESGKWRIWPYIEFTGGKHLWKDAETITILEEGD